MDFRSAGRSARTTPPPVCEGPTTMTGASIMGTASVTPGMARNRLRMASRSGPLIAAPVT